MNTKVENWLILKITNPDNSILFKVFASWSGGYLDGDSWRINSGISEVKEDKDFYYFYGYSGSCYECPKNKYGTATSYSSVVLAKMLNVSEKNNIQLDLMDSKEDFKNLLKL